ncbi:hypothetical protein D5086_000424, partial [Populus alba]
SCRLHRITRNPSFEESRILTEAYLLDRSRATARIHTTIQCLLCLALTVLDPFEKPQAVISEESKVVILEELFSYQTVESVTKTNT